MTRRQNRGQAMAEFVVMTAGCLLLLFVLVPVVAKMGDMSYKAQEAARYTAWERTVWYTPNGGNETNPSQIDTTNGHLATRTDADIFNSAAGRLLPFTAEPIAFAPQDINEPEGLQNNFWRWTHGRSSPMATVQNAALDNNRTPSLAYSIIDTYNDVMGGIAKVISIFSFGRGDDDFLQVAHPIETFYTSEISIPIDLTNSRLGAQPIISDEVGPLAVGARAAVLADGWVAQSEGHFEEKANDFVLGTMIEKNPIWQTLRDIIGVFEWSFNDIDFAPVNTDPMPDSDFDCNITTGFCYFTD